MGAVGLVLSILLYDKLDFPYRETVINIVVVGLASFLAIILVSFIVRVSSYLLRSHAQMILGQSREFTCQFLGSSGTLSQASGTNRDS